jgi:two-component system sensor histidine kinase TctE
MPDSRTPTLRRRLLRSLLAPLLVLAVLGITADYFQARQLTNESYDQVLASTAIGLASRLELERDGDLQDHLPDSARSLQQLDEKAPFLYAVFNAKGVTVAGLAQLIGIAKAQAGPRHPYFHDEILQGVALRVATYAYDGPEGQGTIVVAETLDRRQQATKLLMKSTAWTSALMVAFTLTAVYFAVRHALRPLDALSQRFELRDAKDLQALSLDGVPGEARPLVIAANQLMARLKDAAVAQQGFLSNTAHQLRTPLAGLQTQLELLRDQPAPANNERLKQVFDAVQRLNHLTKQMLALARADAHAHVAHDLRSVDLCQLLEAAASACLDRALAKGIDLGFEPSPASVIGSQWMLNELLVNLIDNAITYTPSNGRITVSCGLVNSAGSTTPLLPYLSVVDSGRGIALEDRDKVFDRFYRAPGTTETGTGLGLAIVREIANRHGARVELHEGPDGQGLCARVLFAEAESEDPEIP